jgi:hypothetical protein
MMTEQGGGRRPAALQAFLSFRRGRRHGRQRHLSRHGRGSRPDGRRPRGFPAVQPARHRRNGPGRAMCACAQVLIRHQIQRTGRQQQTTICAFCRPAPHTDRQPCKGRDQSCEHALIVNLMANVLIVHVLSVIVHVLPVIVHVRLVHVLTVNVLLVHVLVHVLVVIRGWVSAGRPWEQSAARVTHRRSARVHRGEGAGQAGALLPSRGVASLLRRHVALPDWLCVSRLAFSFSR